MKFLHFPRNKSSDTIVFSSINKRREMRLLIIELCTASFVARNFDGLVIPLSLQADFNLDRSLDSSHGTHGQIVLDDKRNSFTGQNNINYNSHIMRNKKNKLF